MKKSLTIAILAVLVIVLAAGCALYFTSDSYRIEKYLKLAEQCYTEEKYEEALQVLVDGLEVTGAKELAERAAYLREHIVVVEEKEYDQNGNVTLWTEYDTSGNEIKLNL